MQYNNNQQQQQGSYRQNHHGTSPGAGRGRGGGGNQRYNNHNGGGFQQHYNAQQPQVQQQKPKSFKNLYVGGLPQGVTDTDLTALFNQFGAIRSAKVMLDVDTGESRGYGFVLYGKEEEGASAFAKLNKQETTIGGLPAVLDVRASRHDGRQASVESTTIYVRNIPSAVTEERVREHFEKFGPIESLLLRPQPAATPNTPSKEGSTAEAAAAETNLQLGTVVYQQIGAARDAIEQTHTNKVFAECSLPILAKFAETKQVREQRKAKKMDTNVMGASPSGDGTVEVENNTAPSQPSGQQQQQRHNTGNNQQQGRTAPQHHQNGHGNNHPQQQPQQGQSGSNNVYPNAVRLPLERRNGHQYVYYQGVLGLTPDGVLYPVKPEACTYVNAPSSSNGAGPGPAWSGAPMPPPVFGSSVGGQTPTVPASMLLGISQTSVQDNSFASSPPAMLVVQPTTPAQNTNGATPPPVVAQQPSDTNAAWQQLNNALRQGEPAVLGASPGPMET